MLLESLQALPAIYKELLQDITAVTTVGLRERLDEIYAAGEEPMDDAAAGDSVDAEKRSKAQAKCIDMAKSALRELSQMTCRNGRMVEVSLVMTGLTGYNSNPAPLGAGAGAVQASLYQIKERTQSLNLHTGTHTHISMHLLSCEVS